MIYKYIENGIIVYIGESNRIPSNGVEITPEEKAKSENMLTGTLKTLFNVTENYPQLQANQNFLDLQSTLKSLEVEIANSRKYYNGCVKVYNNKIQIFPSNLIAGRFNFEKKVLFEIVNEEERVAPKVQF